MRQLRDTTGLPYKLLHMKQYRFERDLESTLPGCLSAGLLRKGSLANTGHTTYVYEDQANG